MSTLSVWEFDTADGANDAVSTLENLSQRRLIRIHDAATVSWPEEAKKPKIRQLRNLVGAGALGGAFWGMLFGLLFLVPLLGAAIGAAAGALAGRLTDVGIDDDFIKHVREDITPGTSALFALTSNEVYDRIAAEFSDTDAKLIHTNLSDEQEARLREAFDLDV